MTSTKTTVVAGALLLILVVPHGVATHQGANQALGLDSAIGHGNNNQANGMSSWIGSGSDNLAGGKESVIGGGENNDARGEQSVVAGGKNNDARQDNAAVGGGLDNTASGVAATVSGGFQNTASGTAATVAGGTLNRAAGVASFAAGDGAAADHDRTFVWSDDRANGFTSTGSNQFLISAAGGVGIGTNAPTSALSVDGTVTADAFEGALGWAWLTDQPDIVAGPGLTGGGTLDQTRTLALDDAAISACTGAGDKVIWDPTAQRLACGTDGGNTYTSGDGLLLAAGEFSVAPGGVNLNHLGFDPATQAELDAHKVGSDHDGRYLRNSATGTETFTGGVLRVEGELSAKVLRATSLSYSKDIIFDGGVGWPTGRMGFAGGQLQAFTFNRDMLLDGTLRSRAPDMVLNVGGPDRDQRLWFGRSSGSEYLRWSEATPTFILSDGLIVYGALTESSSIKAKANIETLDGALDDVTQLRGVSYDWKPDSGGEGRDLGLIAEEVAEVVPEAVTFDENGEPIGLRYGHMVGLLVEAVKEQQLLIEEQQAVNDALEARLAAIEAQLGLVPAP